MRLSIAAAVFFSCTTIAAAQSRWTLSAGPEWTPFVSGPFYGGRVRAEYDLTKPTGPLRLRLEGGGFWSPTQDFSGSYVIAGGTFAGARQTFDLSFGLSAALTPLPNARFSPYVVVAGVARQSWKRESIWRQYTGSAPQFNQGTFSTGDLLLQPGVGIRARIASRMFQLEWRHYDYRSLTLGTRLPF
ncbi:MAG TPA: hypothetical protein VJ755_11105 [Gemmatimonadales bacterium]|nr:hypothetical protein [Gemmatimonadales bacterium]